MNYDPNLNLCGRVTRQTVRLTFAQWNYRATHVITVRGNVTGLDVITAAVSNLYEALPEHPLGGIAQAHLTNPETGETLSVSDEEDKGACFLEDMLITAEIIGIEPAGSVADL